MGIIGSHVMWTLPLKAENINGKPSAWSSDLICSERGRDSGTASDRHLGGLESANENGAIAPVFTALRPHGEQTSRAPKLQ
jgi:hypothetical protein